MTVDEYFAMVIFILMGLTFIAFVLIFLYMIYGEKEGSVASSRARSLRKVLHFLLFFSRRFSVTF